MVLARAGLVRLQVYMQLQQQQTSVEAPLLEYWQLPPLPLSAAAPATLLYHQRSIDDVNPKHRSVLQITSVCMLTCASASISSLTT